MTIVDSILFYNLPPEKQKFYNYNIKYSHPKHRQKTYQFPLDLASFDKLSKRIEKNTSFL